MAQTFAAIDQATQTGTTVFGHLDDRTTTLRTSFSGASAPGTPSQGQLWLDTGAANYILKVYADLEGTGAAWYEIGTVLHGDVDLLNNQLVNIRLENVTSETTPAAGNVGEVYLHTTQGKMRLIVSATEREVVWSANNTDYQRIELPANAWFLDVTNPPTAGTKGTTPTCRGWLFDAANELASINVRVPAGFSGDASPKLRIFAALNQGESAGDDLNWTCDLVSSQPNNNEAVSATSTSYTGTTDIGANTADGSVHSTDITLTYNDADNPIAAGDMLTLEIHRTDVTNLGGVIFLGAQLLVPSGEKPTE